MNTKLLQENLFQDVDFKELSKTCKTQEDLTKISQQFMKNSEKGNL